MAPRPERSIEEAATILHPENGKEDPEAKSEGVRSECSPLFSSHNDPKEPEHPTPPDGGWGWAVLMGVMAVNIVVLGHCKSFGVYFENIMSHFNATHSQVAWIQALQISAFSFSSPVASICAQRVGPRRVALVGGILACLGLAFSSIAPSIATLYVSYGLIEGIASGLVFTSGVMMISQYFDKRRGLANGLGMAGNSVGGIMIPLVADVLMKDYGLRGALLIMGGVLLNGCVGAMLWQPVEWHLKKENIREKSLSIEEPTFNTEVTVVPTAPNHSEGLKKSNSADDIVIKSTMSHTCSIEFLPKKHFSDRVENTPLCTEEDNLFPPTASTSLSIQSSSSIPALNDISKLKDFETISKASSFIYLSTFHVGPSSSTLLTKEQMKPTDKSQDDDEFSDQDEPYDVAPEIRLKETSKCPLRCPKNTIIDMSLFKNAVFHVLMISMMCHYFGYPGTQMFLPLRATSLGLSQAQGASLLSALAFADLIGRIGCAWLSDFHFFPRKYWFICGSLFSGVFSICLQFPKSYAALLACSAGFGFASGAYIGLMIALFADAFGGNRVALAYSLANLASGFVTLSGPPLMGYILETTGSYGLCQLILGSVQLLGGSVWAFEPWAVRHELSKRRASANTC